MKSTLKSARSWENYSSDYRKLIEFSKEKGTSVIAANAPRRYVNMVRRMGKNSLLNLPKKVKDFYHRFQFQTLVVSTKRNSRQS